MSRRESRALSRRWLLDLHLRDEYGITSDSLEFAEWGPGHQRQVLGDARHWWRLYDHHAIPASRAAYLEDVAVRRRLGYLAAAAHILKLIRFNVRPGGQRPNLP
jgi:hypothetical protein